MVACVGERSQLIDRAGGPGDGDGMQQAQLGPDLPLGQTGVAFGESSEPLAVQALIAESVCKRSSDSRGQSALVTDSDTLLGMRGRRASRGWLCSTNPAAVIAPAPVHSPAAPVTAAWSSRA